MRVVLAFFLSTDESGFGWHTDFIILFLILYTAMLCRQIQPSFNNPVVTSVKKKSEYSFRSKENDEKRKSTEFMENSFFRSGRE